LVSLNPLMPSTFSRYDLRVVNKAGEKVILFLFRSLSPK